MADETKQPETGGTLTNEEPEPQAPESEPAPSEPTPADAMPLGVIQSGDTPPEGESGPPKD
jgi:hypothetical protein